MRVLLFSVLLAWAAAASAQAFPAKPLRLVVAFVPGRADDYPGRLVAQNLSEVLGQPVVVENRAVAAPDLCDKIVAAGSEPAASTPEELLRTAKVGAAGYDRIIRAANIRAE